PLSCSHSDRPAHRSTLCRPARALGCGTHLRLAQSLSPLEQGLRAAACGCRRLYLSGDGAAHAASLDPVRLTNTLLAVSKGAGSPHMVTRYVDGEYAERGSRRRSLLRPLPHSPRRRLEPHPWPLSAYGEGKRGRGLRGEVPPLPTPDCLFPIPHYFATNNRSPFSTTITVLPSCPITPIGSGRSIANVPITSRTITLRAKMMFSHTTRRARRLRWIA